MEEAPLSESQFAEKLFSGWPNSNGTPPRPKVTAEPPQIGSILFLTRYSVVFQGQQKKTASHATKAGVEEKILPLINT